MWVLISYCLGLFSRAGATWNIDHFTRVWLWGIPNLYRSLISYTGKIFTSIPSITNYLAFLWTHWPLRQVSNLFDNYAFIYIIFCSQNVLISLYFSNIIFKFVDAVLFGLCFHDHRAQWFLGRCQLFLHLIHMSLS